MHRLDCSKILGNDVVQVSSALLHIPHDTAQDALVRVRFYKDLDIHIHATEAAVPKDGPSAGVTMTTGLISALTNSPVLRDIAMTGEITIRGRVLPIGGLKEKSMAAYRGGVKTVFIPKDNLADLEDVDSVVKENIEFIAVSNVEEIIEKAIVFPEKTEEKSEEWVMKNPIVTDSRTPVLRH